MWHDTEYRESNVDSEAGIFLKEPVTATGDVRVYELPAATVASAIHVGSYQRLQEAYDALLRWVGDNGYQVAGPIRELYLQNSQPVRQDDESYITEIQVPIMTS
jgi:effector-binding domain-containing protein